MNSLEQEEKQSASPADINYVIFYESIYQCTPWMNSIRMMNKEGHHVKVYQKKYFGGHYNEELSSTKFEVITSYDPGILHQFFYQTARAFHLLKRIKLEKLSTLGVTLNYFYTTFMFVLSVYMKARKSKDKQVFIAGDPASLVAAYLAVRKRNHLLVYWPLELWVYKDLKLSYFKILKRIERKLHKHAAGTLEFGTQRRAILSRENNIPEDDIYIIPNSPIGEPKPERNFYFNEMFGIPREKKIILYAGGFGDFNGIPQLIDSLDRMPENFALVLHSKQELKKRHLEKMLEKLKPYDAYISSKPLSFDNINVIYSSCDIGLMLMGPNNGDWDTNYTYSDWSPGKMFNYLQFGVPLITTNLAGYKELIDGNGVGKVVDSISDVFLKAEEIMLDEAGYRNNCIRLFNDLKFEKYHNLFYDRVIKKGLN